MAYGNVAKDGTGTFYHLVVTTDGYLRVVLQAGGGVAVDDAAFTAGTDSVNVIGAFADEAGPDSVDEGDQGAVRMSLDRMLLVQASGRAAEDAAVAGNPLLAGGRYDSTPRDLDTGDVGALALDADARAYVNSGWTPSLQSDETADDSDKKFTVPANTEWEILSIWVELTSTGDAGNRQMCIEIQDAADDVILQVRAGIVQAASITRYYLFAPGANELTAFRDTDYLSTAFPAGLVLPATYDIRIWDSKAIAAAADDMICQMTVKARTV